MQRGVANVGDEKNLPGIDYLYFSSNEYDVPVAPEIKRTPTDEQVDEFIERATHLMSQNNGLIDIVVGDLGSSRNGFSNAVIFVDPYIYPLRHEFDTFCGKNSNKTTNETSNKLFFEATLSDFIHFLRGESDSKGVGRKLFNFLKGKVRIIFDDWNVIEREGTIVCKRISGTRFLITYPDGKPIILPSRDKLSFLSELLHEQGKIAMYYSGIVKEDMEFAFNEFDVMLAKEPWDRNTKSFPTGDKLTKRFVWLLQPAYAYKTITDNNSEVCCGPHGRVCKNANQIECSTCNSVNKEDLYKFGMTPNEYESLKQELNKEHPLEYKTLKQELNKECLLGAFLADPISSLYDKLTRSYWSHRDNTVEEKVAAFGLGEYANKILKDLLGFQSDKYIDGRGVLIILSKKKSTASPEEIAKFFDEQSKNFFER
jgi:hypothetical protein